MTPSLKTIMQAFFRRLMMTVLLMIVFILSSTSLRAQNFRAIGVADGILSFDSKTGKAETLYSFSSSNHTPQGDLFEDSNGTVWGTSEFTDKVGAIFKINSDGASITYVHFFRKSNGANPRGSLIEAGGKLWGTTYNGGANNVGIVFTIDLDGKNFTKVHDFTSASGAYPGKRLQLSNGRIWGLTYEGGASDGGVVFSIALDGTDYQVEHTFYSSGDAGYPEGGLIEVGNKLWGLTSYGGVDDYGTIFSIDNDGTNYQVYHSFESSNTDGGIPLGDLVSFNGRLWGLTSEGGINGVGTLFSILPDGIGYSVHHLFDNASGGAPLGNLIMSGNKLWGTTSTKTGNAGTIFSFDALDPNATTIQTVHTFTGTNGALPKSGLLDRSGVLWGVTSGGGTLNRGAIYHINNDGSNFTTAYSFSYWPKYAVGSLVEYNNKFWGMSNNGGVNSTGTIYSMDKDGSNMTIVYSFAATGNAPHGTIPRGGLILKNGLLYGLTNIGGANSVGTFFKFDPTDNSVTALHSFTSAGFAYPSSGLFEYLGNFYGVLGGSAKVIFSIQPDGTNFQTLVGLPGILSDISLLSGGNLWGTERSTGQVFKYDINAAEYTLIKDFTAAFDNSTETPRLTEYLGKIYGVTHKDGANSSGTVFSIAPDGTNFTTLHDFNGTEGSLPVGQLIIKNNVIYGLTSFGGTNLYGVLYKMNLDGSNFTVVQNFNGGDQNSPAIGNFITPKFAPKFLAQIPDFNLIEDFNPIQIDLTQYVYDAEDDIANMIVNITGTGTGKSEVPVSFSIPPPKLTIYGLENNFGSSEITVVIKDSDNNTISTSFTVNIAPVADGVAISNMFLSTTFPDFTSATVISPLAIDRDNNNNSPVTHFQVTAITGGKVYLNDETTEIVDNTFVAISQGTLKFKPSVAGSGSFKVQGSLGTNPINLGGNKATVHISIDPAKAIITWAIPSNFTYGHALTSQDLPTANIPGNFVITALKAGSSPKLLTEGTVLGAGNYTIQMYYTPGDNSYSSEYIEKSLVVNKVPLTATADNKSVEYGTFPNFTVSYSGFVNGEGPAQLSPPDLESLGSFGDAGTYAITFLNPPNSSNYTISTVNGTLTVTKAPLTISVANATKVYGDPNPAFTLNYSGFKNSENLNVIDTPPAISTAALNSPAGIYPITLSGASDNNYDISFSNGQLTITKAPLEIKPEDLIITYGEPLPNLTVSYSGFVNGDGEEKIIIPTIETTATEGSNAGIYQITLSGGSSLYYELFLKNGILTINKKQAAITLSNLEQIYNGHEISVDVVTNPLGLNVIVTYNGSSAKPVATGNYAVSAIIDDINYTGEATSTLVISAITATEEFGEDMEVNVYPNPFIDSFTVKGISEKMESLYVYNSQGQLIINKNSIEASESVNMNGLPEGTYILIISNQGKLISRKITKQ